MLKVLVVLGVCLPLAWAQSGTVQSGGQPIPGATIRATQGERALSTITDDNGAFQFQGMMPGMWSVEADMFGFEPFTKDFTVTDMPTKLDIALVLQGKGQITQQRNPGGRGGGPGAQARGGQPAAQELIADAPPDIAPQVSSSTANDSFQIAGTVSTGLETNNNDFRGGGGGFGGPDFGPGGPGGPGGDFGGPGGPGGPGGDNGGRGGRGNNGGGNFNGGGGGGGRGGGGGGNFNGGGGGGRGGGGNGGGRGGRGGGQQRGLIGNRSKQGASQIRIQAFDTVQDSAFDAKSYAINGVSTAKPQSESNRYGLNVGGPLIIPHLFDLSKKFNFTVNYNGTIAKTARNNFSTLPTSAEQGGDFSSLLAGPTPTLLYDPKSGGTTLFQNNQIPLTRMDPIALALQKQFIPLPNQLGASLVNNYQFVGAPPTNSQQVSIRLQVTVDAKNRLSIQSATNANHQQALQPFGYIDKTNTFGQNQSVQWTHNFTQRLFNTFQIGLNRNSSTGTPYFETLGTDIAGKLGILGTWPDPSNYGPPSLAFGSGFSGLNDGTPSHSAVQTLSLQNSLSWRHGKHNLQFGALFGRLDQNYLTDTSGRGSFSFTGAQTEAYPNGPTGLAAQNTGNGYADFLLGLPQSDSVTWGTDRYYRQLNYSSWVNDDFRFLSNLSLSLGVRYEYTSPIDEKYGRLSNLQFGPGFGNITSVLTGTAPATCTALAAGIPCVTAATAGLPGPLVQTQHGAIEPRIGLAWQAMKRGSLLIRSGYGIYYNEGIYNAISQRLGQQPQFVVASGNLQTSATNVLNLAKGLTQVAAGNVISNTAAYDPNMKLPYTQTWTLGMQRNLPSQLVMQINYTGIKGTHLNLAFDPNQALPGPSATYTQRQPFQLNGVPYAGLMTYSESGANLISNSVQFSLQRRLRNNMSFQTSYTYSKSIDDSVTAINPFDIAAERANSTGVRRNQVNFTMVLESPVDQRKGFLANKGFLTKALKDWTVQTPINWGTGLPLTATVYGDIAGIGTTTPQRAEATGLPVNSGPGFLNLAAFTTPLSGTFGNAGRDTITGPNMFSFNMNMSRTIQLKERKSLEIQLNSTNILNHPVPTSFGTVVNEKTFGVLSGVNGMRVISGTIRFRM